MYIQFPRRTDSQHSMKNRSVGKPHNTRQDKVKDQKVCDTTANKKVTERIHGNQKNSKLIERK